MLVSNLHSGPLKVACLQSLALSIPALHRRLTGDSYSQTPHPFHQINTSHPTLINTSHSTPLINTSHSTPLINTFHPTLINTSHPTPLINTSQSTPLINTSHPTLINTSHPIPLINLGYLQVWPVPLSSHGTHQSYPAHKEDIYPSSAGLPQPVFPAAMELMGISSQTSFVKDGGLWARSSEQKGAGSSEQEGSLGAGSSEQEGSLWVGSSEQEGSLGAGSSEQEGSLWAESSEQEGSLGVESSEQEESSSCGKDVLSYSLARTETIGDSSDTEEYFSCPSACSSPFPVCEAGREQWCSRTSPSPERESSSSVPREEEREGAGAGDSDEWVSVEYQGRSFLRVFSPLRCPEGGAVLASWSITDYTEHGELVFSVRADFIRAAELEPQSSREASSQSTSPSRKHKASSEPTAPNAKQPK
ncbi:hypothetical protein EOD39_9126 [Acipenser ruthenus]|uniref:Uncharacterized protein n=1 Tax=Acipenser ruthenus TaxID=7906 RepID=A0A444U1W4_ACIRT|nr:hypothetical protein EOD39_9126 [Acipenser ruthenus]